MHDVRFPNETRDYREARNRLLEAERDLRRRIEAVAAQRRALPAGGEVPEDYAFDELPAGASKPRTVRLSGLFAPGRDSLLVYSFMYGPKMEKACPMCASVLDSLDGAVEQVAQRAGLAVAAKSPIERIQAFARERGWRRLRLLSSAGNDYDRDYHGEDADGRQLPSLNVFVRRDGKVRHFYHTELLFAPRETGQDGRHVDMIWPLWNLLDLTPEGRGEQFRPKLS